MEEKITILNNKGLKLSAVLHKPESSTDKILILSHSFKSSKDIDTILTNLARILCDLGYVVLRYDMTGAGNSEGEFVNTTVSSQKDDLNSVIKYVRQQDYKEIGLGGLSQGTSVSLMNIDDNIKCLVLFSLAYDLNLLYLRYKDIFESSDVMDGVNHRTHEKIYVGKKMWQEFGSIKLGKYASKVKCPSLIISGSDDSLFRPDQQINFARQFPGIVEQKVIENCDHDFIDPKNEKKAISYAIEFVKKYL